MFTLIAIAFVAASIVSCDKSLPATPSPIPGQPPPEPTIQSIRIDGPAGLAPGGTAQYSATGQLSNGSTRDVTATATWRSSDSDVVSIASGGGALAGKPGQVVIAAEISGRRAAVDVLVLPPGTFRLTGTVSDAAEPIADASVELLDGSRAAISTRTDEAGSYRLFGVVGDVEVRASKAGYASQVNRLIVNGNIASNFELTFNDIPRLEGTYTLHVRGVGPVLAVLLLVNPPRGADTQIHGEHPPVRFAAGSRTQRRPIAEGTLHRSGARNAGNVRHRWPSKPTFLLSVLSPRRKSADRRSRATAISCRIWTG